MAVIEKRAGVNLSNQDAYLNVVGGIRINEPGIDLGIILSVCSSHKNKPIPNDIVVIGEVGLTGEVRRVNMIEKQLKEAEKLGFKKCIIPENNKKLLKEKYKLDIIGVKNIKDAMKGVRTTMRENKQDTIANMIKIVAPGTEIRLGLENILKAKTGGLIVIGDSKEVLDIVDRTVLKLMKNIQLQDYMNLRKCMGQ